MLKYSKITVCWHSPNKSQDMGGVGKYLGTLYALQGVSIKQHWTPKFSKVASILQLWQLVQITD